MSESHKCESCTIEIESGPYCSYCADENGELRPFAERFENMVAWSMKRDGEVTRVQAEEQTLEFMGKLPAWRNHPEYLARVGKS